MHDHPAFIQTSPLPLQERRSAVLICQTALRQTLFHPLPIRRLKLKIAPCTISPIRFVTTAANSEQIRENLSTVSEPILRAVESLSRQPRQTVADISASAGLSIDIATDQTVRLAELTGASIDVTDAGDIAYRFPRNVRAILRTRSLRTALAMTWRRIAPTLFLFSRIAFGALLFISIVVTFIAIAALSAAGQSEDDRRDNRSSSFMAPRLFGPNIFDVMFYSRPYGYYGSTSGYDSRGRERDGMSFLEAVYSFVFGDGDPNETFEERRWRSVATVIRANRGAVTAEQLAPFLDPPGTKDYESALVDESFMLPALTRFQGRPEVTDDGDIIYVFPGFMKTGARGGSASVEIAGSGGVTSVSEAEVKLTSASSGQRIMVVALGVVNVLGVLVLGSQLLSVVPATRDAAQLLAALRGIYPALFAYAASFFAVPLARFLRLKKINQEIRDRNQARSDMARLMARGGVDLRRKIRAAEDFVVRGGNINSDGVIYSSDRDVLDQPSSQTDLTDDFDRRLNG